MTEPWWPSQPAGPTNPPPPQQGQWQPPTSAPPRSPATANLPAGGPTPMPTTAVGVPLPGQQRQAPAMTGLGVLVFLLVVATILFGWLVVAPWVVTWAGSVDGCLDSGGDWACFANDASREQVLVPIVAMLGALCLARGAGVERRQGRGIGYLYALLGFLALGLSWSLGAP